MSRSPSASAHTSSRRAPTSTSTSPSASTQSSSAAPPNAPSRSERSPSAALARGSRVARAGSGRPGRGGCSTFYAACAIVYTGVATIAIAARLLGQELGEQPIECLGPLEHRHVASVLEDHLARVGDQLGEHVGVAHADQPVVVAPDDQRWTGDLAEALADLVVEDRFETLDEAGLAGPAQLLGGKPGFIQGFEAVLD